MNHGLGWPAGEVADATDETDSLSGVSETSVTCLADHEVKA